MSLHIEIFNVVWCEQCGKGFLPTNRRQRFCDANCRVNAHHERNRERARQFLNERLSAFAIPFESFARCSVVLRDVGRDRPAGYAARHAAAKYVPSLVVDCV